MFSLLPVMMVGAVSEVWNGSADTSWYKAGDNTFAITTAEQLAGLAQLVNGGNDFSGNTVTLGEDILLNDTTGWESWDNITIGLYSWTPIGNSASSFQGTFVGHDKIISGLYINAGFALQGLFGYIGEGGIVSNVGVEESFIYGSYNVGGLAGYIATGNLTNCYNSGEVSGENTIGGLLGFSSNSFTLNCYYNITTFTGGAFGYGSDVTDLPAGITAGQPEDAFTGGKVAWLLQNEQSEFVWGLSRNGTDARPHLAVFGSEEAPVIKIVRMMWYSEPGIFFAVSYADGKIYYTLDGTTPTQNSTLYTKGIIIDKDMTVKAIVVSGGGTSNAAAFTYEVRAAKISFKDKASEIRYIKSHGDKFDPDLAITRYEALTSLSLLLDLEKADTGKTLTDVADEHRDLAALFAGAGVIDGFPDGLFGGENGLTRSEFVKIMSVVLGLDLKSGTSKFDDMKGHWAEQYIAEFEKLGYVNGYLDNKFMPDNIVTRAEFVTIINRIIGTETVSVPPVFEDVQNSHWAYGDIMAVYMK